MPQYSELAKALWAISAEALEITARYPALASDAIVANLSKHDIEQLLLLKREEADLELVREATRVRFQGLTYEENVAQIEAAEAKAQSVHRCAEVERERAYRTLHDEDDARLTEMDINEQERIDVDAIFADSPLAEELALQRLEAIAEEMDSIISKALS